MDWEFKILISVRSEGGLQYLLHHYDNVRKEEEIDHMVNLPVDAKNQSLTQSTGNLIKINIRKSGAYVLMGKQVTEEQISDWMKTEVEKKPDIKVLIRSDQDAKHLYLANVMSICRHVGVPRANIAVKTER